MRKLFLLLAGSALAAVSAGADLRFTAAGNEYRFDTGVVRGTLRGGGKSDGLTEVVHIATGKVLTKGHGLAGFYRILTAAHRYQPESWSAPSEAKLRDDGSVEAWWPAGADRPFEQWVVYRWTSATTLDLDIRVRPNTTIQGFEVFFASYFSDTFNRSRACVNRRKPALIPAEKADGDWQMFPRDAAAVGMIQDGRWKHPPSPVDWRIRPELAFPLGVRQDTGSGVSVLIMAPAEDCFAVSMPYQTEGHRSLYLSLFGRDVRAGQDLRTSARLVFGEFRNDKEMLQAWQAFRKRVRR